ncbi:MAG: EAL domain-containing protein [Gammaproteobacteria bacterium]|jgi:EAL domain-containing protein (putative c-di-GMP-specific phosphodiesterase class I)/GGDEF domain-containing protein|nr:EAL domain-containing protein [Gammaproteobacteria bacterium]
MAPDELLQGLAEQMQAGATEGRGGVILLRFDRSRMMRDQLGFSGLAALSERVAEYIADRLEGDVETARFDWGSLLVTVKDRSGKALDEAARSLFDSLADQTFAVLDDDVALTVSLSFARFDHRFTDVDEMLLPMLRQVEQIESEGGNAMAEARPGISARMALDSTDHMLGLLMEALRTDSIRVVFQPLLATSGQDATENYQMLPRLAAGDGKLITAAEFLPLAREASLLPVIDRWMTVHAMHLLRGPLQDRDVRLFINQSEALLADAARRQWLDKQLGSDPAMAKHTVLELPLEDAMAHLKGARDLFEVARRRGFGICLSHIDEHSRWELLSGELEPDYIRMAPGFVARLAREPSLEKRFMSLSETVREQGTRIIMPMIEDTQTAASMWRSGADYMQGNMIQAPEDSIAV